MEPIHVIPPPVTSDMFYDVGNSMYHHHYHPHYVPAQNPFWHQPSSRLNRAEQDDVISHHQTTMEQDDVINHHQTTAQPSLFTSGNDASVMTDSSGDTPCRDNIIPTLADSADVTARRLGISQSPTAEEGHVSKTDQVQSKDWCGGHDDTIDQQSSDHTVKDIQSSGEDLTSGKESQVTSTLKWLNTNYELSEGVCLPRCVLYLHYLDFCKRQAFKPAGAATFGKLIRQKFKNITTRRLGTRGQSKYHYYGIGIKESSIYYQSVYTGKGLTRFSGIKIKTEGTSRKYSLGSKTGTLLPDFPSAHNLILPDHIAVEKMDTFIMMYRTHSQRILDTVISANFEEIQNLLIHFWQGYPQHLIDVLQLPVTVEVVALCDSILYKVLIDVLIPGTIQDLPESLSTDLRAFLRSLPRWIENSLDDLVPQTVRQIKSRILQTFLRAMKRQLAFVKMATTARPHLTNLEVTTQALADLDTIDLDQMCARTGFALNDKSLGCSGKAVEVYSELKSLLQKQSSVEGFIEWLDNLIDKNVLQDEIVPTKFKQRASRFLLQWTMFGALIMKDLTLNSAKSFSFLHLIKMTLDEYVFLVMETQTDKHHDDVLQRNLQVHMKNAEEIKTNAKVRTQANRLQGSPKSRKRKAEENETSRGGVEGDPETITPNQASCQSFQAPPPSSSDPTIGTAFSRPLPSNSNHDDRDIIITTTTTTTSNSNTIDGCTTAAAIAQANEVLRPATLTPHPLSISPIKGYPPYDRPSYLPTFGLNSYTDYIGHHSNAFNPCPRQVPAAFQDHHVHTQPFQPVPFNPTLNPTPPAPPPSYWASESRPHHASSLTDAYTQLTYNSYQQPYDPYKTPSLLRASAVYHQDNLARSSATALDGFSRSTFDSLARAGPALDNLTRHNSGGLDGLTRSCATFESPRSTVPYYARPHDHLQVGSSFSVGSYSNGFMDMAPPSGQYGKQEGLLYQDDLFASNMAAASGLAGFGKSYLSSSYR